MTIDTPPTEQVSTNSFPRVPPLFRTVLSCGRDSADPLNLANPECFRSDTPLGGVFLVDLQPAAL